MFKKWWLLIGVSAFFFTHLSDLQGFFNQNKEELDLFSFSIQTSASPNQVNIIELKEMGQNVKEVKGNHKSPVYHSFRIYYGEYGSMLEEYKEYEQFDLSTVDGFDIQWMNDDEVTIHVMRKKEDGRRFTAESIELHLSSE